jgi:hypothetical protein
MRYIVEPTGNYWRVVDLVTEYVLGIYERREPAMAWRNYLAKQQNLK